jgi:hypothetical protein
MSLFSLASDCFRRSSLYRKLRMNRHQTEFRRWDRGGRKTPPPHLMKQHLIRRFAAQHRCATLVETGTFRGDMLLAMLHDFRKLYSIELHPRLFSRAQRLFQNQPKVHLLHGDSGQRIAEVLRELNEPAVFWLDGHYSAGNTAKADLNTPVIAELNQVLEHRIPNHVILIDDARLFNGQDDYPTLDIVKAQVARVGKFDIQIEDDVITITRKAA